MWLRVPEAGGRETQLEAIAVYGASEKAQIWPRERNWGGDHAGPWAGSVRYLEETQMAGKGLTSG